LKWNEMKILKIHPVLLIISFYLLSLSNPLALQAMGSKGGKPSNAAPQKGVPKGPIPETIQITVPPGTSFKVTVNQALSSSKNKTGQSFTASLKDPIMLGGQVLVPVGAQFEGFLSRVIESGRFQGTALLEIRLNRVTLPDQSVYVLATEPVLKQGRAHLLRNMGLIGGGAILGAGIGSALGQISGAIIGIGSGGGTGAVLAYVTGKEELTYKTGSEVVFKLSLPITVSVKPNATAPK